MEDGTWIGCRYRGVRWGEGGARMDVLQTRMGLHQLHACAFVKKIPCMGMGAYKRHAFTTFTH